MITLTRTFLLLAIGLLHNAQAQIKVVTPRWLKKGIASDLGDGFVMGSTATFGAPMYGEQILGQIHWSDPGEHMHCTDDDYDVPTVAPSSKGMDQKELVNVIMVRRGKCSFTTKVRVASKKGAHAVIVVDSEDSASTASDIQNLIVGNDGFGDSITIPSILIDNESGQKLIDASKKSTIIVELNWNVPDRHIVTVDMWMNAGSQETAQFLKDFSPFRRVLADDMSFWPHYHVYSVPILDQPSFTNLCADSQGTFCADDPDAGGELTGKDVLHEDVRQLCIHESTSKVRTSSKVENPDVHPEAFLTKTYSEAYWMYLEMLPDWCPLQAGRFGAECSYKLMTRIAWMGIDVDAMRKCELQTFDAKLKHELESHAWSKSAIRINGMRYAGHLDAETVAKAICSGFVNPPPECQRVMDGISVVTKKRPSISLAIFAKAVVALLALIALMFFGYKRFLGKQMHAQIREEVMLEVQTQMGSYSQMRS